ncbi:MAG: DUF116 domain-containing protein [Nitrospira sp.]|nr:DUF116 domain-containing protein [bacterium]MBL7048963.1 DUF116 domain-containing protein [Nitrospira sp.]
MLKIEGYENSSSANMIKKLKFISHLYRYKLQGLLSLKRSDIMSVINAYYREDFIKIAKNEVAVILPHCLINDKCPARFSKTDGILCNSCNLCGCGDIRETALSRNYQFYITPSVGFTKRLITRKNLRGVIGVACDYEIEKGIRAENISNNGLAVERRKIKTQGLRLNVYDCVNNTVEWNKIKELL